MGSLAQNQRACATCAYAGWNKAANGVVPCTIDGRDIRAHYTSNACPRGFFADGAPPPTLADFRATEGPKRWAELHRRAAAWAGGSAELVAAELAFIRELANGLGGACACKQHWGRHLMKHPPDLSSAAAYSAWATAAHDAINAKLGKPLLGNCQNVARCKFGRTAATAGRIILPTWVRGAPSIRC